MPSESFIVISFGRPQSHVYLAQWSHWRGSRGQRQSWLLSDEKIATTTHNGWERFIQTWIQTASCGHIQPRRTRNAAQYKNCKATENNRSVRTRTSDSIALFLGVSFALVCSNVRSLDAPGRESVEENFPMFPGSKRGASCLVQISLNKLNSTEGICDTFGNILQLSVEKKLFLSPSLQSISWVF